MNCKWMDDEMCVNDKSPVCADYCPVADHQELCKYAEEKKKEMFRFKHWSAMADVLAVFSNNCVKNNLYGKIHITSGRGPTGDYHGIAFFAGDGKGRTRECSYSFEYIKEARDVAKIANDIRKMFFEITGRWEG